MPEVQPEQYTGLFALISNGEATEFVAISDMLGIVSLNVAGIWTAQQCEAKLEEILGRSLTVAEGLDLTTFAQYVAAGGDMAECRLQKIRNGMEMVERKFNLTDAEIRQLAGV
jgi:hypothetical protein